MLPWIQVILHLVGNVASGRTEANRSCSQKISQREFFCEQEKKYHAAAGESGHYRAQTPSLQTYRVGSVNEKITLRANFIKERVWGYGVNG
ncbi:MAG: hypothetical protein ACLFVO_05670 [Chloroflexaceae bacterium]